MALRVAQEFFIFRGNIMTLLDIFNQIGTTGKTVFVVVLLIVLSLIRIKPLECNLLGWAIRWIGSNFNHGINSKFNMRFDQLESKQTDLQNRLEEIKANLTEHKADEARTRILRFGDEMLQGVRHSHDSWIQIMRDIKRYLDYCNEHPEYENNVTGPTSERISSIFQKHCDEKDFFDM